MYQTKLRKHLSDYKKSDYLKVEEPGKEKDEILVDCSFGVNPFGHSKQIHIKNHEESLHISSYSELGAFKLRRALIDYWRPVAELDYENISITDGSMGILDSLNSIYIDAGDQILGYSPQFPEYVESLKIRGGDYISLELKEENNYKFAPEEFIKYIVKNEYKLVYVDNPNNPTGQIIPIEDIERIVKTAQESNTIVIVDEAYGDYMEQSNSAISLINTYNNVYVVRSFSKGFALAGMRVGYLIASPGLMENFRIIEDFLVNQVGIKIAEIAISDKEYLKDTIKKTRKSKSEIISKLRKMKVLETNMEVPIFTMVHPDKSVNLYNLMREYGINTTSGFLNLGKNAVRIRIPDSNEKLLELLRKLEGSI